MALEERNKALTTLKPGQLGDRPDMARDEMFIDPSPYLGLRGFGIGKGFYERYCHGQKNSRGSVDPGDAARARTRGIEHHTPPADELSTTGAEPAQTRAFGKARRRKRS